jgi:hypothetical protein
MSRRAKPALALTRVLVAAVVALSSSRATAQIAQKGSSTPAGDRAQAPTDVVAADEEPAQLPYEVPRQTLVPGVPGMPGGYHFMVNAFAQLQNTGLGGYRISNQNVASWNGGATYPLLTDDWAMAYGRDSGGWVEGLLMLDFEPATVFSAGYPELGQSGEGLWDAQHSHQLIHQAMIAVHPLAGLGGWHPVSMMQEGRYDLSVFGGQGSATIGPPIFMHRASSPGPTVPRKHHKGENPHETFPVVGAALRVGDTWFEASAFSARELTPQDSRWYPHPAAPESLAARVRHTFGGWLEVQASGERLVDQGQREPDAYQLDASAYAWGTVSGWRLDALADWAIDVPDVDATGQRNTAQGALLEAAARTPDRRQTVWVRSELDQREESPAFGGGVSSPWLFETIGFEHVVAGGAKSGMQLGLFGEATYVNIPPSLRGFYGTDSAATLNVGLHLFGMWMVDASCRPMQHTHAM